MSNAPLTPTRKKQLEAYIACCARVEKSIMAAHHVAQGMVYNPKSWQARSLRVKRLAERMRHDKANIYALPFIRLQIARSKLSAELSGLGYHG
jgi:hypothetical protein